MTVDHLSGGRLELALGVGDPSAGAAAAGIGWPAAERVARFREFVQLTELLLRQDTTRYEGRFYRCVAAESVPRPVQRPRPPITIAAHGPKMLRIAAEYGDGWSCHRHGARTPAKTRYLTRSPARSYHVYVCRDDLAGDAALDASAFQPSAVRTAAMPYFAALSARGALLPGGRGRL